MIVRKYLAILAATALAAGCTTFVGNVKGAFSCKAPAGTCAPTSIIDGKVAEAGQDDTLAIAPTSRSRPLAAGAGALSAARSAERTITIVFPPYIDQAGVLHEAATAHAVVEPPHWASAQADPVSFSRSPAPSSLREVVAGASAPAAEGLEPLPTQAPHPITDAASAPSNDAITAARAGHRIERTVGPIETAKPPIPSTPAATASADPARAAKERVRRSLAPVLQKQSGDPDLGDVFRPAQQPEVGQ